MKKITTCCALLLQCIFLNAQNVGIGNPIPAEKLDVTGNINLTGQLKTNGNAGNANQVLQKDAANNLVWADLSQYKNLQVFDCNSITAVAGSGNCTSTWPVPAGVTEIFVECWGGGGGGCSYTGGGGGGYISGKFTVTPATTATLTIGAGGQFCTGSLNPAILGGTTTFSISGSYIQANGGNGGMNGDPTLNGGINIPPGGGSSSNLAAQYLGYSGQPGGLTRISFQQISATEFAKILDYGNGGDAANMPGSGARGGYRIIGTSFFQSSQSSSPAGTLPGGGGGADQSNGWSGRGGRIVIHW